MRPDALDQGAGLRRARGVRRVAQLREQIIEDFCARLDRRRRRGKTRAGEQGEADGE